jgi:hypothetical protein
MTETTASHSVYMNVPQNFIVFNEHLLSSDAPIEASDLTAVEARGDAMNRLRSMAWSCYIEWFIVAMDGGVGLFSVAADRGVFCRKPTILFLEWFLASPMAGGR